MSNRRGFTLIEALIVMVVIALAGLIVTPRVTSGLAHGNVLAGRSKIISLYGRARAVAMQSGQTGILVINGNNAYVVARPRRTVGGAGTFDTVTRVESMYTQYGLTLSSTADSVRVGPTGVGLNGTNTQVIVRKGSYAADTVNISAFGQVLK